MTTVTERIARDIDDQVAEARNNLALHAQQIAKAEQLAQQLSSTGISALAHGRAEGLWIRVWVTAYVTHPGRLDDALSRLDLRTLDSTPGREDCELRLEGHDFPLYITYPDEPANY